MPAKPRISLIKTQSARLPPLAVWPPSCLEPRAAVPRRVELPNLADFAAIGGIAYKALRNYQEGKPLVQGVPGLEQLTAAPEGTSFSELAHTNDTALLLIRTMVATAAADGVVEPSQRAVIVGQLKGSGLNPEAAKFLDAEIQRPATVSEISTAVGSSHDLATQVYAAAHLIAATPPEKAFLENLTKALALDPALVAYLNAAAASVTAPLN